LLVPIVVIDELDGLKQHRDNKVRWRAGYTLAVLDRVLPRPTAVAPLREADFSALSSGGIPRGEISVEVLFDPPGHVRLPINDDEIIDRALAVVPLAVREVTLVTYDTGQCMRARAAGLDAKKLNKPLAEEPA
jgi:predicted ribonuclease YlaK